jgi:beta-glucanase (GH16 family)
MMRPSVSGMKYSSFTRSLPYLSICLMLSTSGEASTRCAADLPPCVAPTGGPLTFSDDFHALNSAKWATTFPWGARNLGGSGGSGELQEYVDQSYRGLGLDPFLIGKGGSVAIQASETTSQLRQALDGKRYISGLLTTYHSFSQTYGYFEMRARFPYGKGLWPAFWLAPSDMSWPPEIDVVECLGDQPTRLYATLHVNGSHERDRPVEFAIDVADMTSAFHNYGVLWDADYVAWYFDGRRVAYTPTPKSISRPMYMLVNLAVGGKWAGNPDETTHFPATMEISYIRAYQPSQRTIGQAPAVSGH